MTRTNMSLATGSSLRDVGSLPSRHAMFFTTRINGYAAAASFRFSWPSLVSPVTHPSGSESPSSTISMRFTPSFTVTVSTTRQSEPTKTLDLAPSALDAFSPPPTTAESIASVSRATITPIATCTGLSANG